MRPLRLRPNGFQLKILAGISVRVGVRVTIIPCSQADAQYIKTHHTTKNWVLNNQIRVGFNSARAAMK